MVIIISTSIVDGKKRHHRTEAQEWYFGLMNDPGYFERSKSL
jgi:hypothetical protein